MPSRDCHHSLSGALFSSPRRNTLGRLLSPRGLTRGMLDSSAVRLALRARLFDAFAPLPSAILIAPSQHAGRQSRAAPTQAGFHSPGLLGVPVEPPSRFWPDLTARTPNWIAIAGFALLGKQRSTGARPEGRRPVCGSLSGNSRREDVGLVFQSRDHGRAHSPEGPQQCPPQEKTVCPSSFTASKGTLSLEPPLRCSACFALDPGPASRFAWLLRRVLRVLPAGLQAGLSASPHVQQGDFAAPYGPSGAEEAACATRRQDEEQAGCLSRAAAGGRRQPEPRGAQGERRAHRGGPAAGQKRRQHGRQWQRRRPAPEAGVVRLRARGGACVACQGPGGGVARALPPRRATAALAVRLAGQGCGHVAQRFACGQGRRRRLGPRERRRLAEHGRGRGRGGAAGGAAPRGGRGGRGGDRGGGGDGGAAARGAARAGVARVVVSSRVEPRCLARHSVGGRRRARRAAACPPPRSRQRPVSPRCGRARGRGGRRVAARQHDRLALAGRNARRVARGRRRARGRGRGRCALAHRSAAAAASGGGGKRAVAAPGCVGGPPRGGRGGRRARRL
jgi:hypothetical protein